MMQIRTTGPTSRSFFQVGFCLMAALTGVSGCDQLTGVSETAETVLLQELNRQLEVTEFTQQQDPDGDGLSTVQEEQVGTDPHNPDSDYDTINDRTELLQASDPNTPRNEQTVDGVPSAFDGLIEPGTSRTFTRGSDAVSTAYVRVMGLIRRDTTLNIKLEHVVEGVPVSSLTTLVEMKPRQYWCWGHDLGPQAIIASPETMIVTRMTVTVEEGGDSVFWSFISSYGLDSGPRGVVPFPPALADGNYDFNLLMAHGAYRDASGWDSFALMLERIAPGVQIIRTSVDPEGLIPRRAGQLSRFIQREQVPTLYVIAHSQGGLDTRYILTKAAEGDPHFSPTADSICGLYTLGTPHYGLTLSDLTVGLPDDLFIDEEPDDEAPRLTPTPGDSSNPSQKTLDWMNETFPGDVTLGDRVIPITAFVFHARFVAMNASDGVVKLFSQAFGDHVINDVPSTRGAGPGAGRHVGSIPARAEPEQENYEVLGRILQDILERRAATDSSNPCPR